jgi:hypothetical protein
MTQNEDQMAEATIGALANLATAIAADRCGGSSNSGKFSSCETTRGNFFRVEGIESFAQSGTPLNSSRASDSIEGL